MSIVKLRQEKNKQALRKYILYALLAEVFFIPLSPTLATVALIIGIILTGWRFFLHRLLKVTPLQFDTPIIIFIIISALSILVSPDKFFSFYNFYNLVGVYALTYFLIGQNIETAEDLKITMFALFAAFILSVIYGYWQAIFGISVSDVKWVDGDAFPELKRRIFSTWENPNIFAGFLDMCIALLLGIYAKCKYNKEKAVCVVLMILGAGALFLTYARGAMLSLFVVVAVYGFIKDKRLLVVCAVLVGLAFALNPLALERITSVVAAADTSSEMRLAIWEATIAMIEDHPLLGIGWGAYFMAYPEYDFYMQGETILIVHAHNIYLNYGAEIGVLGALAFFWYFFGTMNLALTTKFGKEETVEEKTVEKENIIEENDISDEVKSENAMKDAKIIPMDAPNNIEKNTDNKEVAEETEKVEAAEEAEEIQEVDEGEKIEDVEATKDDQETKEDNDEYKENSTVVEPETVESNIENDGEDGEESVEKETDSTENEVVKEDVDEGEEKEEIIETTEATLVDDSDKAADTSDVPEEIEEKKFSFKEFINEPFFEDGESLQRGVSFGIGLAFVTVALNGLTDDLLFNIPTSMFLWMLAAIAAKNVKIER